MKVVYVGKETYFSKKMNTNVCEVYLLKPINGEKGEGYKPIMRQTAYGLKGVRMNVNRLPEGIKLNSVCEIDFNENGTLSHFDLVK